MANEHAIARDPLTLDGYVAGRWINEPLRVFDWAFEVDGGIALILTSADRARDLAQPPVRIVCTANSHGHGGSWDQWPDPTSMFSARVAPRVLDRAKSEIDGIGDIDVACIYHCFSYTGMFVLEGFGFADNGEIGAFYAEGRASYGADVVVNPRGGLLSEGYLHGLNTHYEAVVQLRGQGGDRQVRDAEVALVTAGAGPYGRGSDLRGGPMTGDLPIQPRSTPDTAGFWDATSRGELALCWCSSCQYFQHPPLDRCRRCATATSWKPVSGRGVLYSYIVVHRVVAPGYLDQPQHVFGLVELVEQQGLRLSTQLLDVKPTTVEIDMALQATLVPLPGGDRRVPMFRPKENGDDNRRPTPQTLCKGRTTMTTQTRASDTETTRAVVQRAYECGNAYDFEGFAALLADEVVVEEADGHPCPGTYHGKAEVLSGVASVLGAIGMTRIDVHDLVVDGPLAIALINITCTGADGKPFAMAVAEAFWVYNGQITKIRPYYFDTAMLAARCAPTAGP